MRSPPRLMLIGAAAVWLQMGAAQAGPVSSSPGGAIRALPSQTAVCYLQILDHIRQAELRQQVRDGGTLTDAHRVAFERRRAYAADFYRRSLQNNNPLTVNADGHPTSPAEVPQDWTNSKLLRVGAPS